MSDYINTVLSRAIGLSEGIRPKVPSLFEPMEAQSKIADTIMAEDKTAQDIGKRDDHFQSPDNKRSSGKRPPPESGSRLAMPFSKDINARMQDKEDIRIDPPLGETQGFQKDHFDGGLDAVEKGSPERLSVHGEDGIGDDRHRYEKEPLFMDAPGGELTPENDPKIPDSSGNMDIKAQLSLDKRLEGAIEHQSSHQLPSGWKETQKAASSPSLHAEFRSSKTLMKDPGISDSSGSMDIRARSSLDKRLGNAIDHQSPHPSPSGWKGSQKADFSTSPHAELSGSKNSNGVQSPKSVESSSEKPRSVIDELMQTAPSSGQMQPSNRQMKGGLSIDEYRSLTEESSQGPPAIKVTIGRIEVKAAAVTEKKAPPPATKARSLSLDEYLLSLKR